MGLRGPKSIAELAMIGPKRSVSARKRSSSEADQTPPPDHLSEATKAWWRGIIERHNLEPHQLRTLQAAAESWDRYQQAREALAETGLSYVDSKDMIRARPEVAIERDARTSYLRALRELKLDAEPPKPLSSRQPWPLYDVK